MPYPEAGPVEALVFGILASLSYGYNFWWSYQLKIHNDVMAEQGKAALTWDQAKHLSGLSSAEEHKVLRLFRSRLVNPTANTPSFWFEMGNAQSNSDGYSNSV